MTSCLKSLIEIITWKIANGLIHEERIFNKSWAKHCFSVIIGLKDTKLELIRCKTLVSKIELEPRTNYDFPLITHWRILPITDPTQFPFLVTLKIEKSGQSLKITRL